MTLEVWNSFSKPQNSTKVPTGTGTQYNVVMKRDTSLLNPVFIIDGVNLAATYCKFNNRYYFIDDIVLQNNSIYELHCHVDSLATWKSAIGSSSQYVLRSASTYDGQIVDGFYPTKKKPTLARIAPTSSPSWASDLNAGHYIVGIISGSDATGGVSGTIQQGCVQYYHMTATDFNLFAQKVFTDANWTSFSTTDRYTFNPIQYVSSVMWFPFAPSISTTPVASLKVGWETFSLQCDRITDPINTQSYTFQLSDHPQAATRGDYLKCAPFSEYILSFPPFADVEIDGDILQLNASVNNSITAVIQTDFVSGRSVMVVRMYKSVNPTEYYIFARREVQLGVTIQLAQIAANRIGLLQDGLSGAASVIGNLVTGNIVGTIASAASGIMSAYQTAQPRVLSNGSNDSLLALLQRYTDPYVYEIFHEIVDEDNTNHGRPLCQVKTISSLSGYILCANAEISIAGFSTEREEIMRYMDGGFFYE